jgi:multidrug efflux pump subunit AcrB
MIQNPLAERPLPEGYTAELAGEGEWKITVDVFRDLGLAFAAALVMIYVLLVGQTGSLSVTAGDDDSHSTDGYRHRHHARFLVA